MKKERQAFSYSSLIPHPSSLGSPCAGRHLHIRHAAQDDPLPSRNATRIQLRVKIFAWVRNDGGEKSRLARREIRRRFMEVVLRCRFRAITTVTPFGHIQVEFAHATLRQLRF